MTSGDGGQADQRPDRPPAQFRRQPTAAHHVPAPARRWRRQQQNRLEQPIRRFPQEEDPAEVDEGDRDHQVAQQRCRGGEDWPNRPLPVSNPPSCVSRSVTVIGRVQAQSACSRGPEPGRVVDGSAASCGFARRWPQTAVGSAERARQSCRQWAAPPTAAARTPPVGGDKACQRIERGGHGSGRQNTQDEDF